MSPSTVESIIRKAVSDPNFRAALVANPVETLDDFDLTAEERARLSKLDTGVFDGNIELEERVSRLISP
jgi:hypothetical protein